MAGAGDVANRWISCELILKNGTQFNMAQCGTFPESDVRQIEIVAELDTGCKHLALLPEQIQQLQLQPIGEPIPVKSVLNQGSKMIQLYGPVWIIFCGQGASVYAYQMEHASHALLGLEAAQKLKIDVEWKACKVILPSTGYVHNAYTIGPEDLFSLFGPDSRTIIGLQNQYFVGIEISNRKKVNKIVVIICTAKNRQNILAAVEAIKKICPSLTPAPEEERNT